MPLTGLGLYGGHRGDRWLRNRIKIFKQFVLPSLVGQTNQNFTLWVSARHEDRNDKTMSNFKKFLETMTPLDVVFTYSGVCFWDDKYDDKTAYTRLVNAIQGSMGELINTVGESKKILMTIQPSDDAYRLDFVEKTQQFFKKNPKYDVYGFKKGYVMDYVNMKLTEWNPTTTPPFYTIKFTRDIFTDPLKHVNFIGPYKSHEYVKDYMRALYSDERMFVVGTHGENISTIFNHPFAGEVFEDGFATGILGGFNMAGTTPLRLKISLRKKLLRKLPPNWQRKLRYLLGERLVNRIYQWIRS